MLLREGSRRSGVGPDQFETGVQEELGSGEVGKRGAQRRQGSDRGRRIGQRQQRHRARALTRDEQESQPGEHPERALAAAQQRHQVVAGVVLDQPAEPGQDGSVRKDGLSPDHLGAHAAVAQDPDATGVGRDQAPDRCRVTSCEINTEVQPCRAGVLLQGRQGHPRPDRHLCGGRVDRSEVGEAGEAQDHLTAGRNAAADQAGVAALHHDRLPGGSARTQDLSDFLRRTRPDNGQCGAGEAAGPVGLIARAQVGVDQDVLVADNRTKVSEQGHRSTHSRTVSGRALRAVTMSSESSGATSVTT